MKNTIGNSITMTVFGESHGPAVGVVLDGLTPGLKVDKDFIARQLSLRRPSGRTDTARVENDDFSIISGEYQGYTTGTPLTIVIPNQNVRSADYDNLRTCPRPSHADFTAEMKYHGFQDPRGGGHFSGRITAGIVAAGAICLQALEAKGIRIGTHILRCGKVEDVSFCDVETEIKTLSGKHFPVISDVETEMTEHITAAASTGDSVGGVIQTAITGVPAGVGEPWFDSLEGVISRAVFAIGGIKGIEFGLGFGFADSCGSQANDAFCLKDGGVQTSSNNNGGINGGISNGMPIIFNMAVKPTPSISRTQQTVDIEKGEVVDLNIKGRHDPAIIRRICIVVTSLLAVVLCDVLAQRFGTDYLK
ncbi:MAG: chorismate synthase [Bacteroidales bacterium]|nr:chorismate synthase [Bacteroidales bacterium]